MIKTPEQIAKMRIAGKLAAKVLDMITPYVKPGISTGELDQICEAYIVNQLNATPSTKNHLGFPASICTSLNHVVCHGIPTLKKRLKSGDILNIDVTVKQDGYIGDTSRMYLVGQVKPFAKRLVHVTEECLYKGIELVKPGAQIGDIGHAIERHAKANGYSIVEEYCGHGIGEQMWEEPQILHYGKAGTGLVLEAGMTFTIEPMLNQGQRHIHTKPDGWTIVTKDRKLSAQWEHTLLVTPSGCDILTVSGQP